MVKLLKAGTRLPQAGMAAWPFEMLLPTAGSLTGPLLVPNRQQAALAVPDTPAGRQPTMPPQPFAAAGLRPLPLALSPSGRLIAEEWSTQQICP
jgi:hypothetical protein